MTSNGSEDDRVIGIIVRHALREIVAVGVFTVLAGIDGLVRSDVPAVDGAGAAGVVAGVLTPCFEGDGWGGSKDGRGRRRRRRRR